MRRLALAALALLLVAGSGALHGVLCGRWRTGAAADEGPDLEGALRPAGRAWSVLEVTAAPGGEAGIDRRWTARYRHVRSGEVVVLFLVGGLPGPVSIHTPLDCYPGSGYALRGRPERVGVGGTPDEFWAADFVKSRAGEREQVRILWAWGDGQRWEASESPRLAYAGRPRLYKLYLTRQRDPDRPAGPAEPCVELFKELEGGVRRVLAGGRHPPLEDRSSPDGTEGRFQ